MAFVGSRAAVCVYDECAERIIRKYDNGRSVYVPVKGPYTRCQCARLSRTEAWYRRGLSSHCRSDRQRATVFGHARRIIISLVISHGYFGHAAYCPLLLRGVNIPTAMHRKNIRISTDILCMRVFHILTEPVPHSFVFVNRRNNQARGPILPAFTEPVSLKYGKLATYIRRYTDIFTVYYSNTRLSCSR